MGSPRLSDDEARSWTLGGELRGNASSKTGRLDRQSRQLEDPLRTGVLDHLFPLMTSKVPFATSGVGYEQLLEQGSLWMGRQRWKGGDGWGAEGGGERRVGVA